MSSALSWPGAGLVLLAPAGAQPQPAARLAQQLGLRPLEWALSAADDPAPTLAALAQEPPGWLLPLPLDPGADLAVEGCWADALAAWRQPTLLLLPATAVATGQHRAYRALLDLAGVPLLGLVQLGLPWCPEQRRRDGLPWLGCLTLEEVFEDPALPLLIRRRWTARQGAQA
jgi:hypothetical protein